MLIVRRIKPETLHLVHPLNGTFLADEDVLLRISRLGLQMSFAPALKSEWREFSPPYADPACLMQNPSCAFYGAFADDEYIGCAAVTVSPQGWADVIELRVDAAHRRQGAGRMLLDKCTSFARKNGLHGVRIICTDTNPAMCRFCASTGFELCGYDQMAVSRTPEERMKPRNRRASLLYFYRLEKG